MQTHRLVAPIALVLVVGIAFADDASRRNVISQISSKLDSAAYELSGMERKSDASDIDDALNHVYAVERLLEDLGRVAGTDSETAQILSTYPGYIKEFRYSAGELKKLKLQQPAASGYLRQCQTFDKEMIAKAQSVKDDMRAALELTEFVKEAGRKGEDLMNEAGRMARAQPQRSKTLLRERAAVECSSNQPPDLYGCHRTGLDHQLRERAAGVQ